METLEIHAVMLGSDLCHTSDTPEGRRRAGQADQAGWFEMPACWARCEQSCSQGGIKRVWHLHAADKGLHPLTTTPV